MSGVHITINGNAESIYASPSLFVPRPVISTLGVAWLKVLLVTQGMTRRRPE